MCRRCFRLCRLCACCAFCGFLAVVGLTLFVVAPAVWHLLDAAFAPPPQVAYFANVETPRVLPLAPLTYPEAFHGVIWMDQGGAYGHSDVSLLAAPDLALSFGDAEYDPKTRTLALDLTGPSWIWHNSWQAYAAFALIRGLRYFYLFELNADASVVQVYPALDAGPLGKWYMPKSLMSFTMVKIPAAPASVCPPKPGAAKRDIIKCAKWDRVTTLWLSPLFGEYGVFHYYVYQILDAGGKPVQPYYDAYLKHANTTCRPNRMAAKMFGLGAPRAAECPTAFAGLRVPGYRAPPPGPSTEL